MGFGIWALRFEAQGYNVQGCTLRVDVEIRPLLRIKIDFEGEGRVGVQQVYIQCSPLNES